VELRNALQRVPWKKRLAMCSPAVWCVLQRVLQRVLQCVLQCVVQFVLQCVAVCVAGASP